MFEAAAKLREKEETLMRKAEQMREEVKREREAMREVARLARDNPTAPAIVAEATNSVRQMSRSRSEPPKKEQQMEDHQDEHDDAHAGNVSYNEEAPTLIESTPERVP